MSGMDGRRGRDRGAAPAGRRAVNWSLTRGAQYLETLLGGHSKGQPAPFRRGRALSTTAGTHRDVPRDSGQTFLQGLGRDVPRDSDVRPGTGRRDVYTVSHAVLRSAGHLTSPRDRWTGVQHPSWRACSVEMGGQTPHPPRRFSASCRRCSASCRSLAAEDLVPAADPNPW